MRRVSKKEQTTTKQKQFEHIRLYFAIEILTSGAQTIDAAWLLNHQAGHAETIAPIQCDFRQPDTQLTGFECCLTPFGQRLTEGERCSLATFY